MEGTAGKKSDSQNDQDKKRYYTLLNFINNTSFHGAKFMLDEERSFLGRCLWLLVLFCCLTLLLACSANRVYLYVSHQSVTDIQLKHLSQQRMPAVTFCGNNYFRITKVHKERLVNFIASTLSITEKFQSKTEMDVVGDSQKSTVDLLQKLVHRKNDFIHSCRFRGERCSPNALKTFVDDGGVCFTFSSDGNATTSDQLSVLLNLQRFEHFVGSSTPTGAKVIIHEPEVVPEPELDGLAIAPGQSCKITFEKTLVKMLPPPHGSCQVGAPSKSKCRRKCLAEVICKACQCRSPFLLDSPPVSDWNASVNEYPRPADQMNCSTICDFHKTFECARPSSYYNRKMFRLRNSRCNCISPCQLSRYSTQVTYGELTGNEVTSLRKIRRQALRALDVRFRVEVALRRKLKNHIAAFKQLLWHISELETNFLDYFGGKPGRNGEVFASDLTIFLDDLSQFIERSAERRRGIARMTPVFDGVPELNNLWTKEKSILQKCDENNFQKTNESLLNLQREMTGGIKVVEMISKTVSRYDDILGVLWSTSVFQKDHPSYQCRVLLKNFSTKWTENLRQISHAISTLYSDRTCDSQQLRKIINLSGLVNDFASLENAHCDLTKGIYLDEAKFLDKRPGLARKINQLSTWAVSLSNSHGIFNLVVQLRNQVEQVVSMWESEEINILQLLKFFNPNHRLSFLSRANWTAKVISLPTFHKGEELCELYRDTIDDLNEILRENHGLYVPLFPSWKRKPSRLLLHVEQNYNATTSQRLFDFASWLQTDDEYLKYTRKAAQVVKDTKYCKEIIAEFQKALLNVKNTQVPIHNFLRKKIDKCLSDDKLVKSNVLHVVVQFSSDLVTAITQKESFSWESMMGEIGGMAGLLLGASVISVLEVVDFVVRQISRFPFAGPQSIRVARCKGEVVQESSANN